MTDQEINVAIAEFLERKFHKPTEEEIKSGSYYQYEPDLCNDLNAIHEATTKHLSAEQQQQFAWALYALLRPGQLICLADANQYAEAFLRTVGKWVETPDERQSADLGIQTQKQH